MIRHLWLLMMVVATGTAQAQAVCSETWYRSIEQQVVSGDGQGHGPDLGSDEWQSAIEFKLGVRGQPGVPSRGSPDWCGYIDRLVRERNATTSHGTTNATGPSYSCAKVRPGSVEAMVCTDAELSALDRTLAEVYAAASKKSTNERPPRLKAEQNGWIKGRNECWKNADQRSCVRTEYQRRIAELQARYRLVAGTGPVRYQCGGSAADEVVATFYPTEPPTLIAERGDSVSLMYLQPSGSGAKYQGRNESLWEHQGEALVTWGHGAPEMHCKRAP